MPNLMNEIFSHSSTYRTMQSIVKDADSIRKSLMGTYKDTTVRVSELKRNNKHIQAMFRWFSRESEDPNGNGPSSLEEPENEFDPGVRFDEDEDEKEQSQVLDADDVQSLVAEQTREMHKIASKQIESKLITTVEIVKTIDVRASETVAMLRNIESETAGIANKLDKLIQTSQSVLDKVRKEQRTSRLHNYSGQITFGSLSEYIRSNRQKVTKSLTESLMDMTGLATLDRQLNEQVQSFQHNMLLKIFDIPVIKKYMNPFGQYTDDYSRYVENNYNRDHAIFDNMARKTIVSVIPEYLKRITEIVTGKRYNISSAGSLTTAPIQNKFIRSIDVTFDASKFSDKEIKNITNDAKKIDNDFSSADMKEVLRIMVEQYVYMMYSSPESKNDISPDFFIGGGDHALHLHIAKLLAKGKGKSVQYWLDIINVYSTKLMSNRDYRSNFATSINKALVGLDNAARRNIVESQYVTDTQFTQEMFDKRALERMKHDTSEFEYEGKTLRQLISEKVITMASLTEKQRQNLDKPISKFSDLADKIEDSWEQETKSMLFGIKSDNLSILKGIFEIVNRGVNVLFLKRKHRKQYQPINFTSITQPQPEENGTPSHQLPHEEQIFEPTLAPIDQQKDVDDEEKISEASTILKTSAVTGETNPAQLMTQLGSMSNLTTQQRIKTVITGTMERSSKKEPKDSKIGKVLSFAFMIGKGFVTKILSGAKIFLNNRVADFVKKMLASSANKIVGGARAIKESFFGSDESVGFIGRLKNRSKEKKSGTTEQTGTTSTETQGSTDVEGTTERKGSKNLFSSFGTKIKNKLGKSEFGQGILSAFKKRESSRLRAGSLSDTKSSKIEEMLTSTSPTGSVFSAFLSAFDSLKERIEEWFGALKDKRDKDKKKKDAEAKKKKSKAFDIGKIVGGLLNIGIGILQAAFTVIMSMKGVTKIMDLIHNVLTKSLKPLDKAFKSLYKAIKPALKTVQKVLHQIVEYVVEIVESVIKVIQPLLEALNPILEQLFSILQPILELLTDTMDQMVVPFTAIMQTLVVPMLQGVMNYFQMIGGAIEVGFGLVMKAIGVRLIMLGFLLKLLGIGGLYDTGKTLYDSGDYAIQRGADNMAKGFQNSVALMKETYGKLLNPEGTKASEEITENAKRKIEVVDTLNGSPMDGLYGSGDANAPYKFDDDVQEALSNLKELASGIFSMFMPDEADVDTKLQSEKDRLAYGKAQIDTANLTDEERKQIDDKAFELFKSTINNEQLYGETDEEYRARYEKNKERYWAEAAAELVYEKTKKVADGSKENADQLINEALGEDGNTSFLDKMRATDNKVESGGLLTAFAKFISAARDSGDEGYDDTGYYYEGGTGDIFQAASEVFVAAKKAVGGDLHWNGTSVFNITFDDGMVIDKISPTHCTSMMAAIVKRMGYYLPGTNYTDTYQGNDQMTATAGGHGAISWGLQSNDGHPNIYDRDGKVSEDWIMGVGNPQAGDITFGGIGDVIHGHMGAYIGADGNWFGFNGGADDSLASSVKLGEYYLQHGSFPTNNKLNPVPGKWFNDHQWTDQYGAIAPPMSYWVRYVGPTSKAKRRVKKSSSSSVSSKPTSSAKSRSKSSSGKLTSAANSWLDTVAMMFEGYYYNGDKYYDNVNTHTFKIRDGRTVKARPDCSGMLGAAMTAMGYQLDWPPSSTHYNVTGMNGNLDFIHDPDGSVSKDWKLIKFTGNNLQPGDITGNKYHASFPVVNLTAAYPGGFDAGGTDNIAQSAKAARAYLNGESDIPWRSAMGSGAFAAGSGAWNIVRYVGPGAKTTSTKKKTSTKTKKKATTSATSKKKTTTTKKTANTKSTVLSGSTTEQKIYNYLTRNVGMSGKGAAGMMGCMKYESDMKSNNLENTFNAQFGMTDEQYTAAVDSGRESKQQFMYGRNATYIKGQTPGEAVGYGLTQFTSSALKKDLYERTVAKGKSISDIGGQLDATAATLKSRKVGSTTLFQQIKQSRTPTEANQWFLWRYEAGTGYNSDAAVASAYPWMGMQGINDRHNAAEQYYRIYGSGDASVEYGSEFETYDSIPMDLFASDISSGYIDSLIIPDMYEDVPYQEQTGPIFVPGFDQSVAQPESVPEVRTTIINNYHKISAIEYLSNYVDTFANNEYDVQSAVILGLAQQINEEFPEYLDYYFDDEDEDDIQSALDDMEIKQLLASVQ